jgi:hypothetical protein
VHIARYENTNAIDQGSMGLFISIGVNWYRPHITAKTKTPIAKTPPPSNMSKKALCDQATPSTVHHKSILMKAQERQADNHPHPCSGRSRKPFQLYFQISLLPLNLTVSPKNSSTLV